MLELLARLEGQLARVLTPGAHGVSVIVLNNQRDRPLGPETFRANALRSRVTERYPDVEESAEHSP